MKLQILILATLGCLLFSCNPCGDSTMVRVLDSDATPPDKKWMVTVQRETSSGLVSTEIPFEGEDNLLEVMPGDKVSVQWIARDEESGIEAISLKNEFIAAFKEHLGGYTFPQKEQRETGTREAENGCAQRAWILRTTVNVDELFEDLLYAEKSYYMLSGEATNAKGLTCTSQLVIRKKTKG